MYYRCFSSFIAVLSSLSTAVCSFNADEAHLKIHIFPVGEGDATIVECYETTGNVSLTLINAGSINKRKTEIQIEYLNFLEKKLNNPKYRIKAVVLTNADPQHYNFIEPSMIFVKEEDIRKIQFYIGGERSSYISLDNIFSRYENVFQFSREQGSRGRVSSCGHYDGHNNFHRCVKIDKRGPIANSNGIIKICKDFHITIMAANYGFLNERNEMMKDRKGKNSLLYKLTPSGKPSPSILMGEFEDDEEEVDTNIENYERIKRAHSYYTKSANGPITLITGLASTVLKIAKHGALTKSTVSSAFYSDFVQPEYAVVSSDITDSHGHPRCAVVQAVNTYMMKFSAKKRRYQCHTRKPQNEEDIQLLNVSDYLYQTSTIDLNEFPHGKVQFNLITFTMTSNEIRKPATGVIYHILKF